MLGKTIATGALALGLLVGSYGYAGAFYFGGGGGWGGNNSGSSLEIVVHNDGTEVDNSSTAYANTGFNGQEIDLGRSSRRSRSGLSASQVMNTGDAMSDSMADAVVNSTYLEVGCDCPGNGNGDVSTEIEVMNEDTDVENESEAYSKTGYNSQEVEGSSRSRGTIVQRLGTGGAGSLSTAMARVNMTDLRINR